MAVDAVRAVFQFPQPAVGDGFLVFVVFEMLVVDQHSGEVRLRRLGIETVDDGLAGLVIYDLHDARPAVRMFPFGFDLIPAVRGVLEFAV